MIRVMLALMLLTATAQADQIDYLFTCASEAACIADPALASYYTPANADGPGAWRGDVVIPNVQVWDTRQDVSSTDADGDLIVTHTYLTGFWLVVSIAGGNAALAGDANLVLAADRDAANAGRPFVLFSSQPEGSLSFFQLSPTFAGSKYPFGAVP